MFGRYGSRRNFGMLGSLAYIGWRNRSRIQNFINQRRMGRNADVNNSTGDVRPNREGMTSDELIGVPTDLHGRKDNVRKVS